MLRLLATPIWPQWLLPQHQAVWSVRIPQVFWSAETVESQVVTAVVPLVITGEHASHRARQAAVPTEDDGAADVFDDLFIGGGERCPGGAERKADHPEGTGQHVRPAVQIFDRRSDRRKDDARAHREATPLRESWHEHAGARRGERFRKADELGVEPSLP